MDLGRADHELVVDRVVVVDNELHERALADAEVPEVEAAVIDADLDGDDAGPEGRLLVTRTGDGIAADGHGAAHGHGGQGADDTAAVTRARRDRPVGHGPLRRLDRAGDDAHAGTGPAPGGRREPRRRAPRRPR